MGLYKNCNIKPTKDRNEVCIIIKCVLKKYKDSEYISVCVLYKRLFGVQYGKICYLEDCNGDIMYIS